VAALIKSAIGMDPVLVAGGRGEFSVRVDDERVAAKDADGFPADQAILVSIRTAVGKP
jgi:hypothetical protein